MAKRRKFYMRKYKCPGYIRDTLSYLCPPEVLTVSQWAEKFRILSGLSSAMPGRWRNSVTPYLKGIMDEFNEYKTEQIVFCKSTQVGGTEAMQNMIGYTVMQDPAPTMIVYPTDTLINRTVQTRLLPMIEASPDLSGLYDKRRSGNDAIQFENMFIALAGSNSPSGLASTPVRYLYLDEIDKYPSASKKESDAISLAKERTKTFRNKKIYMTSTPTLRTGQIWKAKEACDVERHFFVPCPQCGEMIEFKFSQIRWPAKEEGMSNHDRAEQAYYVCQECGCIINDSDKLQMLKSGEWRDVRKDTELISKVAFWINTLYSPFVRWSEIALEFMKSKDDPEKLQNFTNSWLAEPWEDTKMKTSSDMVLEHRTIYPEFEVPPWAKMLTGGVDVQENSLYWTVRAFGDFITTQCIAYGQALGFDTITKVMNAQYQKKTGELYVPKLTLIDSGDQTDMVYDYCIQNSEWALPCKGMGTRQSHYSISTVNKAGSSAYGMPLVLVDGGKYKDMIAGRLQKPVNSRGSWMVHKDCSEEYASQVTSEQKVAKKTAGGKEQLIWTPKTSHAANHYLDSEVYAFCAGDMLGMRTLYLESERAMEPKPKSKPIEKTNEDDWISGGGW